MPEVESTMVEIAVDGRLLPAYLARPAAGGTAPGIIVIQEWWGLVDHIKDVADRFAREGYVALAPDLYYGSQTDEPDDARKLAMEMDRPRAMQDLEAAAAYLRGMGCPTVGAIGYCMGGGLVMEMATRPGLLNAATPYYGRPLPPERAGEVTVPIYGFFGERDGGIPVADVTALFDALKQAGKDANVEIYAGAEHAFFNDSRPSAYHAEASADAWRRTIEFFKRTLGAPVEVRTS
jgi:carboxymethylenebutenolidase